MKILIAATCALALGLGSAAHAQMASDKPKTDAMGSMSSGAMSSDHMKAEKPMAKKPAKKMAKKPMAKKAETGAMSSSMSTDAMAKH